MLYLVLATTYTEGAAKMLSGKVEVWVAICSIVWAIAGGSSAVMALVALAFAPFADTASLARRWGRDAFWGGVLAVALILSATVFMVSDFETYRDVKSGPAVYRDRIGKTLMAALLTGIVPIVATGARLWSGRTARLVGDP